MLMDVRFAEMKQVQTAGSMHSQGAAPEVPLPRQE
jgi:hypothetical protein